jgi:hypothetical protein
MFQNLRQKTVPIHRADAAKTILKNCAYVPYKAAVWPGGIE